MKLSIALFSLFATQLTFAEPVASCLGEAQVIAQVSEIRSKSLGHCTVGIKAETINQYNVNMTCPLELSDVMTNGIEVGLKDGHDCLYDVGDVISGVLVLNKAGKIILE